MKQKKEKPEVEYVICRYRVRRGKIEYPKNGGFFKFPKKRK
jgi:hypothetical protein